MKIVKGNQIVGEHRQLLKLENIDLKSFAVNALDHHYFLNCFVPRIVVQKEKKELSEKMVHAS